MSGIGFVKKLLTEDFYSLDMKTLKRIGAIQNQEDLVLELSRSYSLGTMPRALTIGLMFNLEKEHLVLGVFRDKEENSFIFGGLIQLDSTPCPYGGKRYWFMCPGSKKEHPCGRRIRILYITHDAFGCRECLNLTYYLRNLSQRLRNSPLYNMRFQKTVERLEAYIKRSKYKNKPTKKKKRLDDLKQKLKNNDVDPFSLLVRPNLN